ncbi:MAG: hypothetical protein K9I82_01460 [Chitinophagaceae bacterium]|nr:hypothetical protein [Chitinophagaceae bacterium]
MNIQKNISRIKQVMRLNENTSLKIKDIIIKRIPFLKEYKIYKHPRYDERLEAQKFRNITDVTTMMGDEMITFPQVSISSEIIYDEHKINENTFHYFTIKNSIHAKAPDDMDNLTQKVLMHVFKMQSDKISYSKEIMVKTGDNIPAEELDKIINDMNGNLFKLEEYTNNANISLF